MKTVMKVALGLALGLTILTVGCAALIGAGAESVSKEMDKQEKQAQAEGRSMIKAINSIHRGDTRASVIEKLGKPEQSHCGDIGLGGSCMLEWDVMSDGKVVSVTISDGVVTAISKSSF